MRKKYVMGLVLAALVMGGCVSDTVMSGGVNYTYNRDNKSWSGTDRYGQSVYISSEKENELNKTLASRYAQEKEFIIYVPVRTRGW